MRAVRRHDRSTYFVLIGCKPSELGRNSRTPVHARCEKSKESPYSIIERRVPELIPDLGSQPAGDVSHKPGARLPCYFPPGLQLPPQPLRGLLPISLLVEQRYDGCEQFA